VSTQSRLTHLRTALASKELDCLLITEPNNRRYMSGFTGSTGVLAISADDALLVTDFRYYEQVRQQAPECQLVEASLSLPKTLGETVGGLGCHTIGFEAHDVTVERLGTWRSAFVQVEFVPTTGTVEGLRTIKDDGELDRIRQAVRIADGAMEYIMGWIRPGVTEREISWELEVQMRTHGAQGLSFTTIVGSGPNGAMSHAVTSERIIQKGDPIVIDMGCVYDGYCSDLTRSFCVGKASEMYLSIWHTVLDAQLAAEDAMKAGMTGSEADQVARDIIYSAGYEGKFGHGLGHGVGLAIHEEPRASRTSKATLVAGNVITIEPGVYDPAWGGIRIEDMGVVTETGLDVMTAVRKVPVI